MLKKDDIVVQTNGNPNLAKIVKVTHLWDDDPAKRIQFWVVFDGQLDDDPYKFYEWEIIKYESAS